MDNNNQKRNMATKKSKSVTKDSICRMAVGEAIPPQGERDMETFRFCSDWCRQKISLTPTGANREGKPGG
jgi:hypothetical protein